jgi:hypothetical protein
MSAYEFRFLNERGNMLLLYFANCLGDEDARARIAMACELAYARFEIWQDDRNVAKGSRQRYLI